MTLAKSFVIFSRNRGDRVPGQVPDPRRHEGYQMMTAKPKVITEKMLLVDDSPRLTLRSVVQNLGFSREDEEDWLQFLESEAGVGVQTHVLNGAFLARARERDLDPYLRLALYRRVQQYLKDAAEREQPIEVQSPLRKAEARGGDYYARTPKPGGGYRYFYSEEDYQKHSGAHVRGEEASTSRAAHAVHQHVQGQGDKGAGHQELRELAKKHGAKAVAKALKGHHEAGTLHYQGGRFYAGGVTHEDPDENENKKAVRKVPSPGKPGGRGARRKGG